MTVLISSRAGLPRLQKTVFNGFPNYTSDKFIQENQARIAVEAAREPGFVKVCAFGFLAANDSLTRLRGLFLNAANMPQIARRRG
jgi:hypothetical protein